MGGKEMQEKAGEAPLLPAQVIEEKAKEANAGKRG